MREKVNNVWIFFKNGFLHLLGANVMNKLVGMVSNMVITRLLTQVEYGTWSYVFNIYSYLQLASGLGLVTGAFQFGAENRGTSKEFDYYKYCLKYGIIVDLILVGGFGIASLVISLSVANVGTLVRVYVPILIIDYIVNLFLTVLRCQNRINEYAKILNFNTILSALGTCVGAWFGVFGVIVGKYIAFLISLFQVIFKSKPEVLRILKAGKLVKGEIKQLWHFSIFNGVSSVLNGVLYLIDITMIARIIKLSSDIAIYKVATLIPTALTFIPYSLVICILPDIVCHNGDLGWLRKRLKKVFMVLGFFNVVFCLVLIMIAPLIITILSGKAYMSAVPIFRVLIVGYFFTGTFRSLSVNTLSGLRRVNFNLLLSVVSGVLDVVLNYIMINEYQVIGAAYATLSIEVLTSAVSLGYLLFVLKSKKVKNEGN